MHIYCWILTNLNFLHLSPFSVRLSSVAQSCPTFCYPMDFNRPGSSVLTVSQSLLEFMSSESVMLSKHFILCHPLLLLHSIFPGIGIFSKESALCIRWPKYWNFSRSSANFYIWWIVCMKNRNVL